ncbi:PQQ-binding-like beta-propeller repeat protein [Gemmatimonadota bacterium]
MNRSATTHTTIRAILCLVAVTALIPFSNGGIVAQASGGQTGIEQIWNQEMEGTTASLQIAGERVVVRLSDRSVEARDVATGGLIWSAARDGAHSVQISGAAGTPWIAILNRFDRPLSSSGRAAGTSWRLSLFSIDASGPVWVPGMGEGDALGCWLIPELDRIALLVRDEQGNGTFTFMKLSDGARVWSLEYGPIDDVPHGEWAAAENYFTTSDDRLFRVDRQEGEMVVTAHDLSSGDLKWVRFMRGERAGLGLISRGGDLFATGRKFTAIDPANGLVLWQRNDPWVPIENQRPWMLVSDVGASRFQLIHVNSGEERWRSTPRAAVGAAGVAGWFPEGLLVGSELGETVLYGINNGRRQDTERVRYPAPGREGIERILVLPDGLLFVRTGPKGNIILRTDARGGTRWQTTLSVPGLPVARGRIRREGQVVTSPVDLGVDGPGGSLWVTGKAPRGAVLVQVDLLTGEEGQSLSISGNEPCFAVCGPLSTVILVAADGRLEAWRYQTP